MTSKTLSLCSLLILLIGVVSFTGCQTRVQAQAEAARLAGLRQTVVVPVNPPAEVAETPVTDEEEIVIETVKPEPIKPIEPAKPETVTYTLESGDSFGGVAYRYGFTLNQVKALNPQVKDVHKVHVGQKIKLPYCDLSKPANPPPKGGKKAVDSARASKGPVYTIQAGDSLSLIAEKFGASIAKIRKANGIKGDRIRVGQKIVILGATKTPSAKAAQKPAVKKPMVKKPVKKPAAKPAVKPVKKPVVAPVDPMMPPAAVPVDPVVADGMTPPPAVDVITPDPVQKYQTHIVQENEDLVSIGMTWGVSVGLLKSINNLTSNEVAVGTEIKIPTTTK